jgi:dihydrofolate reductase
MRRLILLMHASLDGFVAGPNGEMDWIHVDDAMFEYASQRTREADTALYGRVTFEMMNSYWPTAAARPDASKHDIEHSEWYNRVLKVVVSKTLTGTNLANTRIVSDNVTGEILNLKRAPGKEILMLGSPSVAHTLMSQRLIDDYWLFVNPILLGKGIALFKDIAQPVKLQLVTSARLDSGVLCMHYRLG